MSGIISTEYFLKADISFTYNVLGGIANIALFVLIRDEKGFIFYQELYSA